MLLPKDRLFWEETCLLTPAGEEMPSWDKSNLRAPEMTLSNPRLSLSLRSDGVLLARTKRSRYFSTSSLVIFPSANASSHPFRISNLYDAFKILFFLYRPAAPHPKK